MSIKSLPHEAKVARLFLVVSVVLAFFAASHPSSLHAQQSAAQNQAGQTGQAGQAGQTGQAGQAGQTGQAGQAGQAGQGGQAGQAGQVPQPGSSTSSDDQNATFVTSVNEVNLIFTVTDKHGNFIPNLKQSDFALLDDQKAPSRILRFVQQTNLPLRVGIVIDASTSIRTRFQFEQQAATEFLLQVVRSRSDRAFVMGFDSTPTVETDWTNNLDALQTGVNRLRPGGGTALYDAVYTACRDKLLDASKGQEPVRRAMVLVSDGNDNQSRAYIDDAIKMCQRAETIVYAISTNWTPSRGKGDDVLMKIADATGGRAYFPPSVDEISAGFSSIEDELRSQYALTYTPADFKADGAFRTIYLFANDRRYSVRARKGYFSPRQ